MYELDAVLARDNIYDLSSKAAHGSATDTAKLEMPVARSRFLLAKAILATIELAESGKLGLGAPKGDIGKAVAQLARDRTAGIDSPS